MGDVDVARGRARASEGLAAGGVAALQERPEGGGIHFGAGLHAERGGCVPGPVAGALERVGVVPLDSGGAAATLSRLGEHGLFLRGR